MSDFKTVKFHDLSPSLGTYLNLPFIISDESGTSLIEALYRCLQTKAFANADGEYPEDTEVMRTLAAIKTRTLNSLKTLSERYGLPTNSFKTEVYLSPPLATPEGPVQFFTEQIVFQLADAKMVWRQLPTSFALSPEGDNWIGVQILTENNFETQQNASAGDTAEYTDASTDSAGEESQVSSV